MSPVLDRMIAEEDAFRGSTEVIEAYEELERRRKLVAEGKSKLLTKEECLEELKKIRMPCMIFA